MSNIVSAHAVLDALGDPTRRQIVERLGRGPRPVGALADALPVGRPAVSKHLRVLADAGLVRHTAVGTRHLYSLAPAGRDAVQAWLTEQWGEVLGAFAEHVQTLEHAEQRRPP
ncbi:metalloregulator ArsR/SmtB family transcription factor [Isoptericola haloaureus]|uniref:Metalloregulator ArsR/SmtB family transcription factor n=1 Tax=Isoptericola haloaureus TaxID=1542902 RepID=A0ABU7Z2M9_9MICO